MGTLLEGAQVAGHIVHKLIALHKRGADKPIIDAVGKAVDALKAAHSVIHEHWSQPTDPPPTRKG